MALTEQQAQQIKEQLLTQLANFPEDKRRQMKQQILSMSEKDVEQFIKQNQLNHLDKNQPQEQQCIFCSILENKIPSYKIDENKENIAILEINPLSRGHCLVVPKNHVETEKIPSSSFSLAKKIAKKIKTKFKPKEIKISSQNMFGHSIVEVLPLYGNEKERKKATSEELEKLQNQLKSKPRKKSAIKIDSSGKPIKRKKEQISVLPKLPARIP